MTSFDGPSIGARVASYRRLNGWTMEQLASRTHPPIGKSVIANIETGRKSELSVPQLISLAQALGVPPLALLVDLGDVTASAQVALVDASGDLRNLTNLGFIRWFSGTLPLDDPEDDDVLPAQRQAGRILSALHDLIAREEQYAESLAAYGVAAAENKAEASLLLQRASLAEDARSLARRRLTELGVQIRGDRDGAPADPSE